MGNTPDCAGCRFGALGKQPDGQISFGDYILELAAPKG